LTPSENISQIEFPWTSMLSIQSRINISLHPFIEKNHFFDYFSGYGLELFQD
jgi:hypothetical protein